MCSSITSREEWFRYGVLREQIGCTKRILAYHDLIGCVLSPQSIVLLDVATATPYSYTVTNTEGVRSDSESKSMNIGRKGNGQLIARFIQ